MLKGDIFCCRGDMIKAEREYQRLLESEEQPDHLDYTFKLASLYLLQGRFMKSKDLAKQGIGLGEKIGIIWGETWGYLYLAYIHLKSGSPGSPGLKKTALVFCSFNQ